MRAFKVRDGRTVAAAYGREFKVSAGGMELVPGGGTLSASSGYVRAVLATYGAVDSDGDVTDPAAFDGAGTFPIGAYGHASWVGGLMGLPVGLGAIKSSGNEAILLAKFFRTASAKETFDTIQALGPYGAWSYGYRVLDGAPGEFAGQRVRFLRRIGVDEASPVLVGAGVNTRTLEATGLSAAPAGELAEAERREMLAIRGSADDGDEAARQYLRYVALQQQMREAAAR